MQRKNIDIEYFYMIFSGDDREVTSVVFTEEQTTGYGSIETPMCMKLIISIGTKSSEHKITAELTYIGKYDLTGTTLFMQ
jgi:hypothetical protein